MRMYLEQPPSSILAPYVEKRWCSQGSQGYAPAHHRERVLPATGFQVILDLSSSADKPYGG